MSEMLSKSYDLAAVHATIPELGALAVIQYLGVPTGDGYMPYLIKDGKYSIITDPTTIAVGDIVMSGNLTGIVTELLTSTRIIIVFDTRAIQTIGTDPVKREVSYDYATNTADVTDDKKYPNTLNLRSAGFIFLRNITPVALDLALSNLQTDLTAGTISVTTIVATVWAVDDNGVVRSAGGDTVVVAKDGGSAVIGTVTDNADGSYDFNITNTIAETTIITATINASNVGVPATAISLVWSA